MCPLCIGTATLLISGGTSAGGLAAVLLRKPFRRRRAATALQFPATIGLLPTVAGIGANHDSRNVQTLQAAVAQSQNA